MVKPKFTHCGLDIDLLGQILDSLQLGVVLTDKDGVVICWNNWLCKTSGIEKEKAAGRTITEIFPQVVGSRLEYAVEDALNSNLSSIISRSLHKPILPLYSGLEYHEKNLIEQNIYVRAVKDTNSYKKYCLVQVFDMTNAARRERVLTQQKNFLNMIVEASPECINVMNSDGELVSINQAGITILEAASEEDIRKNGILHYIEREFHERFIDLGRRVFAGQTGALEFKVKTEGGHYKWLETTASPFYDGNGNIVSYVGITRDITEHKINEQSLLQHNELLSEQIEYEVGEKMRSQRQYEYLFNITNDLIIVYELLDGLKIGQITEVNNSTCKVLGYSKEELVAMKSETLFGSDDINTIFSTCPVISENGTFLTDNYELLKSRGYCSYTFSLTTKSGEKIPVRGDAYAFAWGGKTLVYNNIRDIRKELEYERKLRVQEGIATQSSKMAAMGQMIGVVAHQWKQPLNVIGLITQNLQMAYEYEELDEEYIKSHIGDVMSQIRFMVDTLDEFRNFLKEDKKTVVFDPKEAVNSVLKILSSELENNEVKVTLSQQQSVFVEGNINEFQQVILNIVDNAKDALLDKKIPVRKVDIDIQASDAQVLIFIKDNAGGVPEELLPDKLFEMHFSTKGKKGTGIGLGISKTIIEERMGGKLLVKNEDDGALFSISLPLRTGQH